MAEQKIKVPEGMLDAVIPFYVDSYNTREARHKILEVALRWLSEHPIVPDDEQRRGISTRDEPLSFNYICTEWQRRMFLASEEIPAGFIECDTCRAKPGSRTLCAGCRHNRNLINKLQAASRPAPQPDVSRVEGCIPRAITFTPAEADYMFECIRAAAHGWSPNTATCAVPDRRSREEAR